MLYNVELRDISHDTPPAGEMKSLPEHLFHCETWPVYARLTDGSVIGCDVIVNAIGVMPNTRMWIAHCPEVHSPLDKQTIVFSVAIGGRWRHPSRRAHDNHCAGRVRMWRCVHGGLDLVTALDAGRGMHISTREICL